MESFKKDLDSDRTSLMRRIVGEYVLTVQESKLNKLLAKRFLWDDTNDTNI